jgi:hypothetical protein
MKIRNATGTAAVSLTALLMFGACGTGGDNGATPPGSGSSDAGETTAAEGGSGDAAAIDAAITGWDPCEVLGDSFNAMIESLNAASANELLSKKTGGGVLPDHAMCSTDVTWAEDPDSRAGNADGLVDISLVPEGSEEDATTRFAELTDGYRDLYEGNAAEKEISGWDEGLLFLGDYGVGDTFIALVRDGSYLIRIGLETGSELVAGGTGTQADFTVEEARNYLIDTALPGVQSAVTARLEEEGVSTGE